MVYPYIFVRFDRDRLPPCWFPEHSATAIRDRGYSDTTSFYTLARTSGTVNVYLDADLPTKRAVLTALALSWGTLRQNLRSKMRLC